MKRKDKRAIASDTAKAIIMSVQNHQDVGHIAHSVHGDAEHSQRLLGTSTMLGSATQAQLRQSASNQRFQRFILLTVLVALTSVIALLVLPINMIGG